MRVYILTTYTGGTVDVLVNCGEEAVTFNTPISVFGLVYVLKALGVEHIVQASATDRWERAYMLNRLYGLRERREGGVRGET